MEEKIKSESIIDILKEEIEELREKNALLERINLELRIENLTLKEKLSKSNTRQKVGLLSEEMCRYRNR